MCDEFVDCRGVEIKLGDVVVYPVRRGSNMVLKEGTVCEPPGTGCVVKKGLRCLNPRGRVVTVSRSDRCAVVGDFKKRKKR